MTDKQPDRERRLMNWRQVPQVQLSLEQTQSCRVLPRREDLLDALPRNAVAAELGVARGDFTREILMRSAPTKLHLIDSWTGERYSEGLAHVRHQFADQISSGKVHLHVGLSTEVLANFEDEYFDWIYIDTDHSFKTTFAELLLGSQKLKSNGRLMGHDFCPGNVITPVPYGVVQACNKFCLEYGWHYEYITLESHGHFSFSLNRAP